MSSLIDIWTVERQRIHVSGAQAFSFTVASLGGGAGLPQGRPTARSDDGQSEDVAAATAAKKEAVGGVPENVRDDVLLDILIDCFGQ
ncbi:hypothetical protein GUJ93_ZPchr0003g16563 [Zizania palustris]|uniref:Uncharacterized protein n=1 Tax=Zizania palustris TaxID=103762 RepID=A0A8J5RK67_ZIZPA|nr:hypothetical protein GUJ93_ZPchr0003g16563 [Zizania palustris]